MPQAYVSFANAPQIGAISLDELPVAADPSTGDSDRLYGRLVRTWSLTGITNDRIDALAYRAGVLYLGVSNPSGGLRIYEFDPDANDGAGGATLRRTFSANDIRVVYGMTYLGSTLFAVGDDEDGDTSLYTLNITAGTVDPRGSEGHIPALRGSLFESNGNLYAVWTPTGGDTSSRARRVSTTAGSFLGNSFTLSADRVQGAVDGYFVAGSVLYSDPLGTPEKVGGNDAPGIGAISPSVTGRTVKGMALRDDPTLTFEGRMGPSSMFGGATATFGHSEITGSAGGTATHKWSSTQAGSSFADDTALSTDWTSVSTTGIFVLERRTVREGVLSVESWQIRVVEGRLLATVECPRRVAPGSVNDISVDVSASGGTTSFSYAWTSSDGSAFADATMAETEWTAPATRGSVTLSVVVTAGDDSFREDCTVLVVSADVGTGGSDVITDFVDRVALPVNEPPATQSYLANRAPEIPGHPSMTTATAKWSSYDLAFGTPTRLSNVAVDARWNQQGAIQLLLLTGTTDHSEMVWMSIWQAGSFHYVRGRVFRRPIPVGADAWFPLSKRTGGRPDAAGEWRFRITGGASNFGLLRQDASLEVFPTSSDNRDMSTALGDLEAGSPVYIEGQQGEWAGWRVTGVPGLATQGHWQIPVLAFTKHPEGPGSSIPQGSVYAVSIGYGRGVEGERWDEPGLLAAFNAIPEGVIVAHGGDVFDASLSGTGPRQPFPDPLGFSSVEAWRVQCFKRRLISSSGLVSFALPNLAQALEWRVAVICNIPASAVHLADDVTDLTTSLAIR